jgi:hypothetical protein
MEAHNRTVVKSLWAHFGEAAEQLRALDSHATRKAVGQGLGIFGFVRQQQGDDRRLAQGRLYETYER